ncbi:HlyD family type I secretion periplasmic adaptor subunit [Guyparkeria halophila]|uniref:Membrane fusion protein (MFP) family protein n=1 Tax=Guyparkeria halophila TaxID=47960 RepID=A0ABZ0Z1K1_9GAMM|nr:HlyD family type I secretion periplasmic adaptor subunit [Guyparkeria halophila]WQH17240.1 HlyD family type I secretion periplasmic adaptor subunit [Guyparkeria halophila]
MGMRWTAWKDVLGRYRRVFAHAWASRRETDPPRREPHEHEFLPAALSLQETPVHPLPRVVVGVIILFAVLALIWALLGRMDIVAVADGKVVPDSRTKTIQAMETASVKAIHVEDGQRVEVGDVLIELDSTISNADVSRLRQEQRVAQLVASRSEAFLVALEDDEMAPKLISDTVVPSRSLDLEQRVLEGHVMRHRARQRQMKAEISRRAQEMSAIRATAASLEETLPIIRRRSEDLKGLADKGMAAQHEYLELEQKRIETAQELLAQKARLAEAKAALHESKEELSAFKAQSRSDALDAMHGAYSKADSLHQELVKARKRDELMRLRAPVTGTVEQLAVHTVGGVVKPAQPLMTIVPEGGGVEVEATLPNKDVGFVQAGQTAKVKLQTFPFTKYGTVPAIVTDVSQDAVQDEKRGLVFVVRVRLERAVVNVHGKPVKIAPGMAATVEVKTGYRRIIEYFLAPLLQYTSESLHER